MFRDFQKENHLVCLLRWKTFWFNIYVKVMRGWNDVNYNAADDDDKSPLPSLSRWCKSRLNLAAAGLSGKVLRQDLVPLPLAGSTGDQTIAEILLDQIKEVIHNSSIKQKQSFGAGVLVFNSMPKTSQENKVYYWGNTKVKVCSRVIFHVLAEAISLYRSPNYLSSLLFWSLRWPWFTFLRARCLWIWGPRQVCLAKWSGPSVKETWWQSHLNHHNKEND